MLRVRNLLRHGARKRIQRLPSPVGVEISRQRHSRRRTARSCVVVDRERQLNRIAGRQILRDLKARHAQSAALSIQRTLKINVRREVTHARRQLQHKRDIIRTCCDLNRKPVLQRFAQRLKILRD